MFRVRRIYDDFLPANREAIAQVQNILRTQFHLLHEDDITKLPEQLRNPLKYRFRSILLIADDGKGHVKGFALMLHAPDLHFCYLDFISTDRKIMGSGIGSVLYERVREESRYLKTIGLFFESLPDDPELCRDPVVLKQNASRLRFYERYGARPIINTAYETPLKPGDDNPPYLVFDDLGQNLPLPRDKARTIVRAILQRKYGQLCPREYTNMVVKSFKDDPVKLRGPRYVKKEPVVQVKPDIPLDKRILLIINDQHWIHHIQEKGYVESPVRIKSILKELRRTEFFHDTEPVHFSERHITMVHNPKYVDYFKKVCAGLEPGKSVYPYVFPIRNAARPPRELSVRAGYYCIDTFTPLNRNAYLAAKKAVDCALTAAKNILTGARLAYALVRPPGHHAERNVFGGFCYFNSSSIAANYLSMFGKTAVLDIDYHHGNGTQDIFYDRPDVLTVSIHGHPNFTYPYFSGFEEEKGTGKGEGYNVNIPLPENIDGIRYREALKKAIRTIIKYQPSFLVIALGLDTAKGDPTGSWNLTGRDFEENGRMLGALRIPSVIVQEGGYDTRVLGVNARKFLTGLWSGSQL
ncbi:MAG: histone deacetylase family protein [Nitrospiraceae bacterium]|nr:MAG: histone deacetylase family protein [Nitrospiraceae bacterium]